MLIIGVDVKKIMLKKCIALLTHENKTLQVVQSAKSSAVFLSVYVSLLSYT